MKNVFLTICFLFFVLGGFAQIEIKGYKIGGIVESPGVIFHSVETTVLGEETTLSFYGEDLGNSYDLSTSRYKSRLKIKSFNFYLSRENAIALMDALVKKYGGDIKKYPNKEEPKSIILISGNTEVEARIGSFGGFQIIVTAHHRNNNTDF